MKTTTIISICAITAYSAVSCMEQSGIVASQKPKSKVNIGYSWNTHRIRITLNSTNIRNLERVARDLIEGAAKERVHTRMPIQEDATSSIPKLIGRGCGKNVISTGGTRKIDALHDRAEEVRKDLAAINPSPSYQRNADGIHIIDIRKQWEKLQLAARAIIKTDVRQDDEDDCSNFNETEELSDYQAPTIFQKLRQKKALCNLKEQFGYKRSKKRTVYLPREKKVLRHKKRLHHNRYQKNKKLPKLHQKMNIVHRGKR